MTDQTPTSATASADFDAARATEIAARNDALRCHRPGGHVMMTAAVAAMPPDTLDATILALHRLDDFAPSNHPHQEHDFGAFEHAGELVLFNIDTHADASLAYGAGNPARARCRPRPDADARQR